MARGDEEPHTRDALRNHILADYEQSIELHRTKEAVEDQQLVDLPIAALNAFALEMRRSRSSPLPVKRFGREAAARDDAQGRQQATRP